MNRRLRSPRPVSQGGPGDCGRRPPSTTHATSGSVSNSRTCRPCGRSALKPTDVFWTSRRFPMIARSVTRRSSRWYGPSSWRGNGLRRCASEMDVYKRCSACWCCSACKRGVLPIPTREPCWLNCWVSTRPITLSADELRSTPLAAAWTHRARSTQPSLRTHHLWTARGVVLLPHLCPALATDPRRHRTLCATRPHPYPRCLSRAFKPSSTRPARRHNLPPDKLDSLASYFMMQVL